MESGRVKAKLIAIDWLGWRNPRMAIKIYRMGIWKPRDIINPFAFALYIPLLARLEGIRTELEVRKRGRGL
jgi:hypothetical protein